MPRSLFFVTRRHGRTTQRFQRPNRGPEAEALLPPPAGVELPEAGTRMG